MTCSTWPGAEVRSAMSARRAAQHQLLALAGLVICAALMATAPPPAPRHLALVVIAVGTAALCAEGLLLWRHHVRLVDGTDQLILAGYPYAGRTDPTSCQVARRTAELCSTAYRARLSRQWRELLKRSARDDWELRSCRYVSHAAVQENAATIARIIAALEHGPGDPAAEVRLRRQAEQIPLPFGPSELQLQSRAVFAQELAAIEHQLTRPE